MTKLTSLEENAAKLFVEGNTQSDAYRKAGYKIDKCTNKTINEAASRVFADNKVSARVKELQELIAKEAVFTAVDAVREYDEARTMAMEEKQTSAAISATKNKCELLGIEAPKKINIEGTIGEWLSSLQGSK